MILYNSRATKITRNDLLNEFVTATIPNLIPMSATIYNENQRNFKSQFNKKIKINFKNNNLRSLIEMFLFRKDDFLNFGD
jgi:hypothetical protein